MRNIISLLFAFMLFQSNFAFAQQSIETICQSVNVVFENSETIVPADIKGNEEALFNSVSIPVELDLAEYLNRPDLAYITGINLRPDIINMEVLQNGQIFFNGKEISNDIDDACARVPEYQSYQSRVRVSNGASTVIDTDIKTEVIFVEGENDTIVLENPVDGNAQKAQDNNDNNL